MTRLDSPIDAVPLVAALPVVPDRRYLELHAKCAAGTIAGDELAELDLMQAMKVAEDLGEAA